MAFKIEITDIDLGDTPIENIFINDFMPMANGTYVKVYLLGYKLANDKDTNIKVNNKTISKHLNIPLVDVLDAWDFWENKGIIKKHFQENMPDTEYTVEFLNLKQLYINNVVKPKNAIISNRYNDSYSNSYKCTPEDLVDAKSIPSVNNMFNEIRKITGRLLNSKECFEIIEWMKNYNMSTDVIIAAYNEGKSKGNRTFSFIKGIIRNWYDQDITNIEALRRHLETKNERYKLYNNVIKALGMTGLISDYQKQMIDKWVDKWNFSENTIMKACEKNINIKEPNFNYTNKILENWYKQNIKTNTDLLNNKNLEKSTNNNFQTSQRFKFYQEIRKYLGINGKLSETQKKYIDKWLDNWKFSMDIIFKAFEKNINIKEPNFSYTNKILENWYKDNIKTIKQIESSSNTSRNSNNKNYNQKNKNNKFHNFKQTTSNYSAEELEKKILNNFNENNN